LIEGSALPKGCNPDAPPHALFTVTDIYPEHVVLDGNHPLAGKDLSFDVEVIEVRVATKEELEHGHVHGEHGHQH
jgi:FKBP-type peptidyl-prolyl cis-trans isomerase SlyD